ncbi:MAG: glycosyltransferase family 2 protein [Frankiaceae bacterium]
MAPSVSIVVPTIGRPSLRALLGSLAAGTSLPEDVVLVDDRRLPMTPLLGSIDDEARSDVPEALRHRVRVLPGRGRGPAAARNVGWRAARGEWVAFLDDDVLPPADWCAALLADLESCADDVGASQGRIEVPLPGDRPPTDWERNVRGLETARWATADMAYRRAALTSSGGFDERFPRAYREDADLGLRTVELGWRIERGRRLVQHPVRPADRWVSVRLQRGNADDVLMRVVHGPRWRERAGVPIGRRRRHLATAAALAVAAGGALTGKRAVGLAGLAAYAAQVAELAWARIAPGPRTRDEVATMLATSAVLPLAATWHWLAGWARVRRLVVTGGPIAAPVDDGVTGTADEGAVVRVTTVELPA